MTTMTIEAKRAFIAEAAAACDHATVRERMEELFSLMDQPADGVLAFGLDRLAIAVAVVARAQALGLDPDDVRATREEIAAELEQVRAVLERAGISVTSSLLRPPSAVTPPSTSPEGRA